MPNLVAFWIARPPFDIAGLSERFGITAHSRDDAFDILRWSGHGISVSLDELVVLRAVTYSSLLEAPGFRSHVESNMGPMIVRGMWYPYLSSAPPDPYVLARSRPENQSP